MQIPSIATTFFLIAVTYAAPQARESLLRPWVWSASGFVGGCSPAACAWGFNITAPKYSHFPSFKAACIGNTLQNSDNWVVCPQRDQDKMVKAKMGPFHEVSDHFIAIMSVSYKFTEQVIQNLSVAYNFTGSGEAWWAPRTRPPTPHNFTITPTEFNVQKS